MGKTRNTTTIFGDKKVQEVVEETKAITGYEYYGSRIFSQKIIKEGSLNRLGVTSFPRKQFRCFCSSFLSYFLTLPFF